MQLMLGSNINEKACFHHSFRLYSMCTRNSAYTSFLYLPSFHKLQEQLHHRFFISRLETDSFVFFFLRSSFFQNILICPTSDTFFVLGSLAHQISHIPVTAEKGRNKSKLFFFNPIFTFSPRVCFQST